MSQQRDFIRNFMAFLDTTELSGVNALNEAVKICTKSKFTTIQALINQMVSDCRQTNDAEKFLQDYCGIDLSNEDTGAITGSDVGGSTVKTAESVVPEVGSLKIYTKNSFKTRGGTFELGQSYSSLTESEKFIWHALYTWWVPNALDLIEESYGSNYNLKDNVMTVYFENDTSFLASANNNVLNISTYYYGNIDTSDVNGSANTTYLDRVISHELTHSVMSKNISGVFWWMPEFLREGMAELTHGIDDERKYTILNIAGNADNLKSVLDVNDSSTNGKTSAYAGGYMFLRYFAKQFSDLGLEFTSGNDFYANYDSDKTLNALGGNDNVNNFSSDKVKIYGADGNDKIYSSDSNGVTIDGGKGNDSIFSSENKKSKIFGGAGKDTIENVGNYVTLSGGSGNDSIKNVSKYYGSSNHKAGNYVKILGDVGNDSISNEGNKVTIDGGTGNDSIKNYSGSNVKIYGGKGNDTIENYSGSKVTISGGAGNDKIFSNDSNVTITGGAGKDYISLSSSSAEKNVIKYASGDGNDTIYGFNSDDTFHITKGTYSAKADGNDIILTVGKGSVRFLDVVNIPIKVKTAKGKIETVLLTYDNSAKNTVVSGSKGNDTISNSGSKVTISGNNGNDYINNSGGSNVKIYGGNGKDTIKNYYDSKVTISGGAGNDTIENYSGSKVKIFGDSGNDSIYSNSSKVTISGGTGNDVINNDYYGSDVKISGDAGNDKIYSNGSNVTITGGKGKDYISLSSYYAEKNVIKYASGDGNDTIYGFNSDDLLHITKGTYTTSLYGSDFIIKVGKQTVTLKDVADDKNGKVKVKGSKGKVSTYDDWKNVFGTSGNDYLTNYEDKLTVDGKAGNDSIYSSGANVTITGGADNDSISNSGSKVKIFGDSGNDSIYSSGANVTITGGTGKDYISLSSYGSENNVIQYASGDGNDTIYGFNSDDIFHITKGSYSAKANGNDVILSIGKSSVRFLDAVDTPIKVKTAKGKFETVSLGSGTDTQSGGGGGTDTQSGGGGGTDTQGVYIFSKSNNTLLSGTSKDDKISNSWGNYVTISSGAGNDDIYSSGNNVKILSDTGNDSILNNSGDYVTISSGSGNDSIRSSGDNVTISSDTGDDTISSGGDNVIISSDSGNDSIYSSGDNVKISTSSGNDSIYSYYGKYVTINGGNGSDSINSDGGENVVIYGEDDSDIISSYYGNQTIYGGKGNDSIFSSSANSKIYGGNGNDTIIISGYHGTTIAGEAGDDVISLENNYYGNIIQYTSGDGDDTISGFKSGHYYDTLEITGGSYSTVSSGDDLVVKVGSGSITLKNVGTQNISIQSSAKNSDLWLFEENNFISSDNLSSILENSSASTAFDKIETPNFENLMQKNNFVISSKKQIC